MNAPAVPAAVATAAADMPKPASGLPTDSQVGRTTLLPGQAPDGRPILAVLLKRSYRIDAGTGAGPAACTRADDDEPLLGGDVFWDTPMNSPTRFESDFVPWKPATDVVVNARAHAPGGRPVERCDVAVEVAGRLRRLTVTGDRRAVFTSATADPRFTDPKPFADLGLHYARAYGGIDVRSAGESPATVGAIWPYPRNPRGTGFAVLNCRAAVDGLALPNVEDPQDLLTPARLCVGDAAQWARQPAPAGLGWVGRNWQPRMDRAGILPGDRAFEQQMRTAYAALLPPEQRALYVKHGLPTMDFAYFNGASPGLVFGFGEVGPGTLVRTLNLTPAGRLDLRLPNDAPRIGIDAAGDGFAPGMQAPATVLQTVQLRLDDPDAAALDLVWRAAIDYPGPDWLPAMRRLHVEVD